MIASPVDPKSARVESAWKHDSPLMRCRFDPRGEFVYSTAEDRSIQRWNLASGERVTFSAHDGWVWGLCPLPDGETLLTGGTDGELIWWPARADAPQPLRRVRAHDGWIRYIAASADGRFVATGSNDRRVKVWNAADGALVHELAGHELDVYAVLFDPSSPIVVSGDLMAKVREWNLESGELLREYDAKDLHTYNGGQAVHFGGVRSITLSPDRKLVAFSGLHKASNPLGAVSDPLVLIFDRETGEQKKTLTVDIRGVAWRAVWHPDGLLVAGSGGSGGGHLLFWNPEDESLIHDFTLPNTARDFDLHPDGSRCATTHHDRHLRVTRIDPPAETTS